MPNRDFFIPLEGSVHIGDRIRVSIRTERGSVVDFVAQYEALIGGRFFAVVRYDGSHGRGHRDIVDRSGHVIQKDWLSQHRSLAKVLNLDVEDIRTNASAYRAEFLDRTSLGGGK
ncbi:MAG: DUF7718 family protein [Thermomicrobiales bacterium]